MALHVGPGGLLGTGPLDAIQTFGNMAQKKTEQDLVYVSLTLSLMVKFANDTLHCSVVEHYDSIKRKNAFIAVT